MGCVRGRYAAGCERDGLSDVWYSQIVGTVGVTEAEAPAPAACCWLGRRLRPAVRAEAWDCLAVPACGLCRMGVALAWRGDGW